MHVDMTYWKLDIRIAKLGCRMQYSWIHEDMIKYKIILKQCQPISGHALVFLAVNSLSDKILMESHGHIDSFISHGPLLL